MWGKLRKCDSSVEKGTFKHLEVLVNRSNVPTLVKNNVSAAEDFLDVALDGHIIAAALAFFDMATISSFPQKHSFSAQLQHASNSEKRNYLTDVTKKFVDTYVLNFAADSSSFCAKRAPTTPGDVDGIYNYACSFLTHGLLARAFRDASREGDGERQYLHWKFLLLHFRTTGHTKYALEAFKLISNVEAILSPWMAHQLFWNRTCNSRGGQGHNIPLDLQIEHHNRVFKDDIGTFRSNITEHSVTRSGQVIGPLGSLLDNFDSQASVKHPSGKHSNNQVSTDRTSL